MLWWLFFFNTLILAGWEFASQHRVKWLQERWPVWMLAVASGGLVTSLAVWGILDFQTHGMVNIAAYLAWLFAAYLVYRVWHPELFILAGGVLSVVIVVATWLGHQMFSTHESATGFLLIGLVVIGLSAAGGFWLRMVAREEGK